MRTRAWLIAGTMLLVVANLAVGAVDVSAPQWRAPEATAKPWLHTFTPQREFYVAPSAPGTGATEADPLALDAAIKQAQPGDLYWLLGGTYRGLGPVNDGTATHPIVWRARPGQRVTFRKVLIGAAHNWVWGLEVTNPENVPVPELSGSGNIVAGARGCHIINNVIHDAWGNGIGGWNNGPGHVYYGNVIFYLRHGYPIYTQNRYSEFGFKYVVQNLFLDARRDSTDAHFNFHGYAEKAATSGFFVAHNIMSDGHFVLGNGVEPYFHEYVIGNYFYRMPSVRIGYWQGSCQAEVRDNYLARSYLETSNFWSLPSGTEKKLEFDKPGPNIYTGNSIILPPEPGLILKTAAGQTMEIGLFPLDPQDVFDHNTYTEPFRATLQAKGKDYGALNFDEWRQATAAAGNAFDAHSQVIPPPTQTKIVLLVNEYDPTRGHLAIFNWAREKNVMVDLSPVVAPGAAFEVHLAKNPFGVPVASGAYAGPVAVPLGEAEFAAFLVTTTAASRAR